MSQEPTPSDAEMSPYAPVALREMYFWEMSADMAHHGWITANGMIRPGLDEYIMEHVVQPSLEHTVRQAKVEGIDPGELLGAVMPQMLELRHLMPVMGQYERSGRQIFDFSERLVDLLKNTDLGACTLEDVHLPYDCIYMHFGKQEHIKTPWEDGFEYVCGALVAKSVYGDSVDSGLVRLKFTVFTEKENGRVAGMPGYYLDIRPDEQKLTVMEAVDAALKRRVEAIQDDSRVPGLTEARVDRFHEAAELIQGTLPLIINGIFYLESLGTLPDATPGRDTPLDLQTKWATVKPTRHHKLKSEMLARGHTLVRLVGKELEAEPSHSLEAGAPGTRAVHWRRGFWRQQPHGAGLLLRKRLWIRPTLVSGRPPEAGEVPGHVYKV